MAIRVQPDEANARATAAPIPAGLSEFLFCDI